MSTRSSGLTSQSSLSDLLAYFASDMNSSVGHSSSGNTFTDTEIASYYYDYLSTQDERAYNYALTQDEREYNEYYYNTYESPAAMVQQYQDAGLNPALMYGSGASTTSSNNSSSPATSSGYTSQGGRGPMNSAYDKLMGILGLVTQVAQAGSQIKMQQAQTKQADATAAKEATDAATAAYDLERKQEADATPNPQTGDTRTSAQLDKETKHWQAIAAEAEALKALDERDITHVQREWTDDLYNQGYNLLQLDADSKEYDNALKAYQSDLNAYLRRNGSFGLEVRKIIAQTLQEEGKATQVEFDTNWLVDAPDWLKPVIGVLSAILSKL